MTYLIAFVLLSIPIVIISWKSLKNIGSHGFYRFLSWESILILLVFNIEFWFTDPLAIHQIISWILLLLSLWLVFAGIITLKRHGKQKNSRKQKDLYAFEKTSALVKSGIYKYIRHPMYSSLLILTWAIFLKNPDWFLVVAVVFSGIFLNLTARADEKECIEYFGDDYKEYMKKTKLFFPYTY
jgi:protein-S-isoprenylcysteine O-methyltransferase Ste14